MNLTTWLPAFLTGGKTFRGPSTLGTNGQILATDGTGGTDWVNNSGGGTSIVNTLTGNETDKAPSVAAVNGGLTDKANSVDLTTHIADTANPHGVTAAQIGLGNVDNTADADKPVSTLQAAAIAQAVSDLVASSPAALDTLNELATALGDDPNFATTVTNALSNKEPSQTAASQAEAEAGTETAIRSFSPLRIFQAIGAYLSNWAGTAATKDVGTAVGDVVQVVDVGGTPGLPALDGSNLTGIAAGGGTPGGTSGLIQFNDGGSFGGAAALTYDATAGNPHLKITNQAATNVGLRIVGASGQSGNYLDILTSALAEVFKVNSNGSAELGTKGGTLKFYGAGSGSVSITSGYFGGQIQVNGDYIGGGACTLGSNATYQGGVNYATSTCLYQHIATNLTSTTSVRGATPSSSNTNGGAVTIDAGPGKGTGTSGTVKFRYAPAGASGSTTNSFSDVMTIDSSGNVIFNNLPTSDPHIVGAAWNNAGILNISAG